MALKNKHTLLLVDDERAITRALKRLFRKQGYGIMTAESGPEGLQLLKETATPVSMIISDQRMPEMNGAQFLEKTKIIFPNAIRYLLTGHSELDAVIQAVNKGEIHRYLTKPWHDEDLLLQVRQSLEHYELASENQRLSAMVIEQNKKISEMGHSIERRVKERTQPIIEQNTALQKHNRKLAQSLVNTIRLLVILSEA